MAPSMSMPRPSEEAVAAFRALVPAAAEVTVRPMFGNVAAFVNGNMFAGLLGDALFVRAAGADADELVARGGRDFEPMPGRPMRGYLVVPGDWRRDGAAGGWVRRALEATAALPAKGPAPPKGAKAAPPAVRETGERAKRK